MIDSDFWRQIEVKFTEYENMLNDLRFPTTEDIQLYQLSYQTAGAVPYKRDGLFFAQPERLLADIAGPLKMLGIPIPHAWADTPALQEIKPLRDHVAAGLKTKNLTPDFVMAWGQYNFACAAVLYLMQSDTAHMYHQKNVKNNMPEILQQCIFAFWMNQHWIEDGLSKTDAQNNLADKICEALSDKHEYQTWKAAAMRNMIDSNAIKKSITNLSRSDIQQLVVRYAAHRQIFEI